MREHEEWLDLVAVAALGALGESEAHAVAAHLETCAECRAEYAALRPVADLVGHAATQAPDELASRRMRANVMAAIGGEPAAPAAPGRRVPVWPAYAAAAAAIVVAAFATFDDANLRGDVNALAERNTVLEHRVAEAGASAAHDRAAVADLIAPDATRYPVAGGDVLTHSDRLYLALRKLPPLPAGKVYQAWTLARGASAVAPDVTFVPDAGGLAVVKLTKDAGGVAAVAVSVEPEGGSQQPTSKPLFIRKLS